MAGSVFTRSMNLQFCQLYNRRFLEWGIYILGVKNNVLVMSVKLVKNKIGIQPRA
jgi:hypothetical protein